MFSNFEFYSPWFFLLFVAFIPLLIKDLYQKKQKGVPVPSVAGMDFGQSGALTRTFLKVSKYFFLSALIIAMARPRTFTVSDDPDDKKGIDIMLAVDVSLSMLAKDLEPDRLSATKEIAKEFIASRPNDKIGLVTYSGEAYTKVPVTSDHEILDDELTNLNPLELQPGTSIGDGLAVAVNHLKDSKAKSKVIILMTDGVNTIENAMQPQMAAELAKNNGIKVYTIGIGTNGSAPFPTGQDIFGDIIFTNEEVKIDEQALLDIARTTGGRYFRAVSNESLKEVYDEINQLEKTDVKSSKLYNYKEYFRWFLLIAVAILLLDALVRWFFYKILR